MRAQSPTILLQLLIVAMIRGVVVNDRADAATAAVACHISSYGHITIPTIRLLITTFLDLNELLNDLRSLKTFILFRVRRRYVMST